MCLAIPGKIIKIDNNKATIEYAGEQRQAIVQDIEVKEGDFVLVQQGFVMQKVDEKEAMESINAWNKLLE